MVETRRLKNIAVFTRLFFLQFATFLSKKKKSLFILPHFALENEEMFSLNGIKPEGT